jgi:hypothetical protein
MHPLQNAHVTGTAKGSRIVPRARVSWIRQAPILPLRKGEKHIERRRLCAES